MTYTDKISADVSSAEDEIKQALNQKKVLCITRKCGRIDKTLKKETDEGFSCEKILCTLFFFEQK